MPVVLCKPFVRRRQGRPTPAAVRTPGSTRGVSGDRCRWRPRRTAPRTSRGDRLACDPTSAGPANQGTAKPAAQQRADRLQYAATAGRGKPAGAVVRPVRLDRLVSALGRTTITAVPAADRRRPPGRRGRDAARRRRGGAAGARPVRRCQPSPPGGPVGVAVSAARPPRCVRWPRGRSDAVSRSPTPPARPDRCRPARRTMMSTGSAPRPAHPPGARRLGGRRRRRGAAAARRRSACDRTVGAACGVGPLGDRRPDRSRPAEPSGVETAASVAPVAAACTGVAVGASASAPSPVARLVRLEPVLVGSSASAAPDAGRRGRLDPVELVGLGRRPPTPVRPGRRSLAALDRPARRAARARRGRRRPRSAASGPRGSGRRPSRLDHPRDDVSSTRSPSRPRPRRPLAGPPRRRRCPRSADGHHRQVVQHDAAATAVRAGLGERLDQAGAHPLAGHLDQAERGHLGDLMPGAVPAERLGQPAQHQLAVGLQHHVDEVDDDDAADVAQPELADHLLGGLQVVLGDRLLEVAAGAGVLAGVDVDDGHRLGPVDDQRAAGRQVHLALQRLGDLLVDPVGGEDVGAARLGASYLTSRSANSGATALTYSETGS